MAIRTPRPRPVSEPTLIGGLARTFLADEERKKQEALEREELTRRRRREDLDFEGEQQRQGIARIKALREGGFEEIGGGVQLEPRPKGPFLDPGDEGIGRGRPGQLPEGLQEPPGPFEPTRPPEARLPGALDAVGPRREPLGPRTRTRQERQNELLTPGRPAGPQFGERAIVPIRDPSRDPSIVNPELRRPDFDFSAIDRALGLDEGVSNEGFKRDPVRFLEFLIENRESLQGGAGGGRGAPDDIDLNDLSKEISNRVDFLLDLSADLRTDSEQRTEFVRQADILTLGMVMLITGTEEFDLDATIELVTRRSEARMTREGEPDPMTEEAIQAEVARLQRLHSGSAEFAQQGREALDPFIIRR
jgi:hypothetical protein